MAGLESEIDARSIRHPLHLPARRRPVSMTSIPRPVSWTSRQYAPSCVISPTPSNISCSINTDSGSMKPMLSSKYARQSLHTPSVPWTQLINSLPDDDYSASSGRSKGATPESCDPHRSKQMSSTGRRSQIGLGEKETANFKASGLAQHKNTWAVPQGNTTAPHLHLPQVPVRKEVTPRRLLQPIPPPFQHSPSLANISFFFADKGHHSACPRDGSETSEHSTTAVRHDPIDTTNLNAGNKLETKNYDLLDISKEAYERQSGRKSSLKLFRSLSNSKTAPTVFASKVEAHFSDDVQDSVLCIPTKPSENIKGSRSMTRKRPSYINTTLANTIRTKVGSLLSTSGSAAIQSSISETFDIDSNPQHVYFPESITYWTGRYMATYDRLRRADYKKMADENKNLRSLVVNSDKFEKIYDKLEESRLKRTLHQLSSSCKTKAARKSLENFESDLLHPQKFQAISRFSRSASDQFWERSSFVRMQDWKDYLVHDDNPTPRHSSESSSCEITANPEKTSNDSQDLEERPGLIKSRTTGDLAIMLSSSSESLASPVRTTALPVNKDDMNELTFPPVRSRKTIGVKMWNGEGEMIGCRGPFAPNPARSNLLHGRINANMQSTSTVASPNLDSISPFYSNLTASLHYPADQVDGPTVPLYRSNSGRHSGTRFLKKVVGISAQEVRKMSKRVSSMGWGSTNDDTDLLN